MKSYFTKNIKIKIVVVCVSILIWFFVETENNFKYTFDIPITVTNISPDKILVNELPPKAKITFWGKGRELLSLILSRKLNYNFDMFDIEESQYHALKKTNVRFPRENNVEIINIVEPDSVFIEIENLVEKKIAVIHDVTINLTPGYTIVNGIQLTPDSIEVVAAKSRIDSVVSITTEKVIYKNVRRKLHKKIKLIEPSIKHFWLKSKNIAFFVDVQKLMEKPLIEIPVRVINKPPNIEIMVVPSSLCLVLVGGVDLLLPITKNDIDAYLDYEKIRVTRERYYRAYIEKPAGVRIKDVKPKQFKVIIKKQH